jgi:hypothetical protein
MLHGILKKLNNEFANSPKADKGRTWSVCTLVATFIPLTNYQIALDDYINSKTGNEIFECAKVFDPTAKQLVKISIS